MDGGESDASGPVAPPGAPDVFEPTPDQDRPVPGVGANETSGLAIASLVCGIFWPFCVTAVLAIIFGHRALGQIERSQGWQRGRGQALAGLWLGYLGLAATLISIVVTSTRG